MQWNTWNYTHCVGHTTTSVRIASCCHNWEHRRAINTIMPAPWQENSSHVACKWWYEQWSRFISGQCPNQSGTLTSLDPCSNKLLAFLRLVGIAYYLKKVRELLKAYLQATLILLTLLVYNVKNSVDCGTTGFGQKCGNELRLKTTFFLELRHWNYTGVDNWLLQPGQWITSLATTTWVVWMAGARGGSANFDCSSQKVGVVRVWPPMLG